jgi:DNA-binding NtrC family response regulator
MADLSVERVLIVEDEPATRMGLTELVRTWGFTADAATDGVDALAKMTDFFPSIVITDLVMPRMGGLDLLRALKSEGAAPTVVLLTAQGSVDTAVEAMKEGAYDYLTKPVEPQRLRILLDKIVELQETLREGQMQRRLARGNGRYGRMIGRSRSMRAVYHMIEQAAPTTASVLVLGESGTGKELVAQMLHQVSPRAQRPFVPINCAAIPETLLESEIFGHEKGAFTGATDRRQGCFELADRGTLFFDEVAEMTPATQVKLLRVLQERSFRRLGGRQELSVDVRIIAATNVNPLDAVKAGKLREDLFYRLNVFAIEVPPLRDRGDDVPILAQAFIDEFNERNHKSIKGLDSAATQMVMEHRWTGNVRELRNAIERAVILAPGPFIEPSHLLAFSEQPASVASDGVSSDLSSALRPGMTVDQAETQLILMTLRHTHDNKTKAAEILGISLKTLHNKLNRLRDRSRSEDNGPDQG